MRKQNLDPFAAVDSRDVRIGAGSLAGGRDSTTADFLQKSWEATMLGFLTIIALQLAAPDPVATDPVISPAAFRRNFDAARNGKLSIPDEAIEEARCFRYVFVGGFHSERLPGYFAQNAKELRAKGVPKRAIHYIYPSSGETVDGNAEMVRKSFEDIACQGTEKLVVIAHSRGSCDALAFALQNPEFVEKHVHSLFLIQGPFGGTGLADYVVGEGPPIDKRMPIGQRVVARSDEGGRLPAAPRQTRRAAVADSPGFGRFLAGRVGGKLRGDSDRRPENFLRHEPDSTLGRRFLQRPLASYLETHFGENDGVVALEDQAVPELGTVLAVLDAGHTDLTNRFPSGRAAQRMRKAVIDAIVMAVGDQEPPDSRERATANRRSSNAERSARKSGAISTGRR